MDSKEQRTFSNGISGYVKAGFEPVIDHYSYLNTIDQDKRGQLCVYVGEEMVIDVIMDNGKQAKGARKFDADSVTTIWSSGKSVASVLLAIMVDQGHLVYDKPIAEYWPEFAQNGKEGVTVADMCRHEGGMHRLS